MVTAIGASLSDIYTELIRIYRSREVDGEVSGQNHAGEPLSAVQSGKDWRCEDPIEEPRSNSLAGNKK